jgi:hypothetical protein
LTKCRSLFDHAVPVGRGTEEGGFGVLELETLIERRVARVGVVGLGYVGLPLAVEFASRTPPASSSSSRSRE